MHKAIRILVLVTTVAAAFPLRGQIADSLQADAYPIIAQLYADPTRFDGRSVTIYGLVIETSSNSVFMLQDVSQHPLKIVGSEKLKAAVGDQLDRGWIISLGAGGSAPFSQICHPDKGPCRRRLLLSATQWEIVWWWVMLAAAVSAAALSIATTMFDRRKSDWPTHRQRFCMHLASYCFLTISILAFVLRGFLAPA